MLTRWPRASAIPRFERPGPHEGSPRVIAEVALEATLGVNDDEVSLTVSITAEAANWQGCLRSPCTETRHKYFNRLTARIARFK